MTETVEKKMLSRYKILNLINAKYNFYQFDITCFEEANEFWTLYFAPVATILPSVDNIDAEICVAIMDNWNDAEELSKVVIPLLRKSTIWESL